MVLLQSLSPLMHINKLTFASSELFLFLYPVGKKNQLLEQSNSGSTFFGGYFHTRCQGSQN